MLNRSAGVLLNISSLPSAYGIGGFGEECQKFCSFLIKGGYHYWQILPLNSIGLGNSPYSGVSAFAGNYLYIDPQMLFAENLISYEEEVVCRGGNMYVTDYEFARKSKSFALHCAFARFFPRYKNELDAFSKKHWVKDYALFMSLKDTHGGSPWWNWEDIYKYYKKFDKDAFINSNQDLYYYYVFEQYIFDKQWTKVKAEINSRHIKIIGDMPMYVSLDSADVWANTSNFMLDENLMPTEVAGVPPDYFSSNGQLWGNPLYDYKTMEKDNYKWWLDRFERMLSLYDVLRIDHFRAFSEYWAVNSKETTAKNGKWKKGVGMKLFDKIKEKFGDLPLIAEDLGIIDDNVRDLLRKTQLPGMRVMQFGFEDGDSIHLPHNFPQDCVGYTATHDNDTTLGWLYKLSPNILDYVLRYIECDPLKWREGGYNCESTKRFIHKLTASSCLLAIVPFQDLCGYGTDCRMNIPGVADGNWTFRATDEAMDSVDCGYFHYINSLYGRNRA